MSLQDEIDEKSKKIHTDGYPMSIGELISLYKEKEIDIHPEFQRFFRWTNLQKTKLIESILLGIPIPSIFVSQRENGIWDVIDGLQRLSTIFEFTGDLVDEKGNKIPPSHLLKTKYLPSLEGKFWEDVNPDLCLTSTQRLIIKREKIDIKIIKKESDDNTKYELFERLNTGGTQLSDQEVRNCLLIMVNRDFYTWIKTLAEVDAFKKCISLSDRLIDEQYDMELVLRFIAYKNFPEEQLNTITDVGLFLTDRAVEIAQNKLLNLDEEKRIFTKTFEMLNLALEDSAFKKYDHSKEKFLGGFLISAFEAIAIGLGSNIDLWINKGDKAKDEIISCTKSIWNNTIFQEWSGSGMAASRRLPKIIPLGKEIFHS